MRAGNPTCAGATALSEICLSIAGCTVCFNVNAVIFIMHARRATLINGKRSRAHMDALLSNQLTGTILLNADECLQ